MGFSTSTRLPASTHRLRPRPSRPLRPSWPLRPSRARPSPPLLLLCRSRRMMGFSTSTRLLASIRRPWPRPSRPRPSPPLPPPCRSQRMMGFSTSTRLLASTRRPSRRPRLQRPRGPIRSSTSLVLRPLSPRRLRFWLRLRLRLPFGPPRWPRRRTAVSAASRWWIRSIRHSVRARTAGRRRSRLRRLPRRSPWRSSICRRWGMVPRRRRPSHAVVFVPPRPRWRTSPGAPSVGRRSVLPRLEWPCPLPAGGAVACWWGPWGSCCCSAVPGPRTSSFPR